MPPRSQRESETIIAGQDLTHPITSPYEISGIAAAVRREGRFCFDLEFVSDGRYVPELAHLPGKTAHTPWDTLGGYDHG